MTQLFSHYASKNTVALLPFISGQLPSNDDSYKVSLSNYKFAT